ncbi:MAG: ABC transporter permease [Gammaproteobacteria bacterium]|nr:ABC transporter permease [Gammaproteobacteria bacterium]
MGSAVEPISLARLALILIPVAALIVIQWRWSISSRSTLYGMARMLAQLLAVGYVLVFLFETDSALLISGVLFVMIAAASWIALRPLEAPGSHLYVLSLSAIAFGALPILYLATQWIIVIEPWYDPRYLIPLAGMLFSNAMNSVSLAAERYASEIARGLSSPEARFAALQAAMIPLVNSLMAVGLVSLPGMMTGQVLSGVSPLIAARYQILVMGMLFSASGIAAATFLYLWSKRSPATH